MTDEMIAERADAAGETFARAIECFRRAKRALDEGARLTEGDVTEAMADVVELSPEVLAQAAMNHLPMPGTRMSPASKAFFMEVGRHMGPDWIAEWRRVGAFMAKVDEF